MHNYGLSTLSLLLTLFMGEKVPGSPHLHNFNVRILEGEAWEQGYNACLVLVRFRSGILGSCSKNSWLPQVSYESHYHTYKYHNLVVFCMCNP